MCVGYIYIYIYVCVCVCVYMNDGMGMPSPGDKIIGYEHFTFPFVLKACVGPNASNRVTLDYAQIT